MANWIGTLGILALALVVGSCGTDASDGGPRSGEQRELTVFAAASLRESLEEIGRAYEAKTGTHVTFNFAGSNELARQIVAAHGADIFVSAAQSWMDTVVSANRAAPGTRRDLLSNSLVVVANAAADLSMSDPCSITTLDVRNLAVGDPDAVPAGRYAREWLSSVECDSGNAWDALRGRIVPTPDVRAALGLVLADPSTIGIVYRTDQHEFADKTKVLFEVNDGPPVKYAVALLNDGDGGDDAPKLLEYLGGAEARAVFETHGFTVIGPATVEAP